jgi:glycosyltransferase involved in cell wall biosynthesis
MMEKPNISIIVPIYNKEKYLSKCIESILNQTYFDFEILLIDDGSLDNCVKICDNFALLDPRIKVFHFENAGALKARIKGVEKASGNFICFVDADDTLPINSLSLLIKRATEYDLDITIGAWYRISSKYPKRIIPLEVSGSFNSINFIKALLNEKIYCGPVGRLYKKSIINIDSFETPFKITNNEDLIMNIKIGVNAHKIAVFNDIVVYNYFERPQSSSQSKYDLDYWLSFYHYLTAVIEDIKDNSDLREDLLRYKLRSIFYKVAQKKIILDNSNRERWIIEESMILRLPLSEKIMIKALKRKSQFFLFNLLFQITKLPQKMIKFSIIINEWLKNK